MSSIEYNLDISWLIYDHLYRYRHIYIIYYIYIYIYIFWIRKEIFLGTIFLHYFELLLLQNAEPVAQSVPVSLSQ